MTDDAFDNASLIRTRQKKCTKTRARALCKSSPSTFFSSYSCHSLCFSVTHTNRFIVVRFPRDFHCEHPEVSATFNYSAGIKTLFFFHKEGAVLAKEKKNKSKTDDAEVVNNSSFLVD